MPTTDNALGNFLKDRRSKLDPASLGYSMARRRTPGLRREEVAQRAHVSPAWYTWLEQGRGGTPSADVLDRLAKGLALTEAERELLFLLAQNRPPEVTPQEPETVDPSLQKLLDSLEYSPAAIRTSAWDVLAANRAARAILAPHVEVQEHHNILESFFCGSHGREGELWARISRTVVAQFRTEAFRAGFGPRAQEVVEGLIRTSPEFAKLWNDLDVGLNLAPVKTFVLPSFGSVTFDTATLAVEGHPGLKIVVFTPATEQDRAAVRRVLGDSP
jgi:transcriptional regulator with XRE-family HTH domain